MKYPPMDEIIGIIHRNQGKAVLAHPGVNLKGHEGILGEILDLGIDGVEAFSSYHTPEQAAEFYWQVQNGVCLPLAAAIIMGKQSQLSP